MSRWYPGRLLSGILLITGLAPASTVFAQPLRWGAGAGASYQHLVLDAPLPEWSDEGLLFPTVFAFAETRLSGVDGPLGRRLHAGAGLRYQRLSGNIRWQFSVGEPAQTFAGDFTIKQHLLALPLWLRLDLGGSPLFLQAGPEPAWVAGASKESRTDTPAEARSARTDAVASQLKRLVMGVRLGAGTRVGARAHIVGSYYAGLTSAKKNAEQPVLVSDWQNRAFEIAMLFYLQR